jgi:hypothetical protein
MLYSRIDKKHHRQRDDVHQNLRLRTHETNTRPAKDTENNNS